MAALCLSRGVIQNVVDSDISIKRGRFPLWSFPLSPRSVAHHWVDVSEPEKSWKGQRWPVAGAKRRGVAVQEAWHSRAIDLRPFTQSMWPTQTNTMLAYYHLDITGRCVPLPTLKRKSSQTFDKKPN